MVASRHGSFAVFFAGKMRLHVTFKFTVSRRIAESLKEQSRKVDVTLP